MAATSRDGDSSDPGGISGDKLAWHALCDELGRPADTSLGDVLIALEATAVPLEVARRILRPSDLLAS